MGNIMGKFASILYLIASVSIGYRVYLLCDMNQYNRLGLLEKIWVISSILITIWVFIVVSYHYIFKPVWTMNKKSNQI
jgi:hypothetical protein